MYVKYGKIKNKIQIQNKIIKFKELRLYRSAEGVTLKWELILTLVYNLDFFVFLKIFELSDHIGQPTKCAWMLTNPVRLLVHFGIVNITIMTKVLHWILILNTVMINVFYDTSFT